MATASVTEAVKESLLGSEIPVPMSKQAEKLFKKYASAELEDGEKAMTKEDFVNAVAPPDQDYRKITREQFGILFNVADRHRRGKLSIQDWARFEHLLTKPDAEYEIAFRLFDLNGNGTVEYEEFVELYNKNRGPNSLPFDWNSKWATLYLGGKNTRHDLTYPQFSQMMRALQGEKIRQFFHHFDPKGTGYIEPEHFQRIIVETAGHKLSDHLVQNLHTLCNISAGSKISYANVRAFQNMVREMDMVDTIVRNAARKSADGKITRTDFLNEAARITRFSHFTPMEADILFHFAGLDNPTGRLSVEDFSRVLDPLWRERDTTPMDELVDALPTISAITHGKGFMGQALHSAYNFALGSLAGAFGATVVYPIDLVKTRMQNQRSKVVGELMYKNSLDCAKKVIRNEGFRGLYSGLGPQLIGVAPEKAIKLTVNDLVRAKAPKREDGSISLPWEIIAGGTAGGCQVVFTNPLEIVKIRLQIQGEVARNVEGVPKRSAIWIVRNLGLVGLYKGASACLLRDVPFSAIYFPAYAHLKKDYFGESPTKKLGIFQLLTAGAIAGMPAAYFTTPCDVIKTRLQVEARKGQTAYRGLTHAATTIWKEEGFKAFFKGGPARVLRSSPQFGCTLAAYELLQTLLPFGGSESKALTGAASPDVGPTEDKMPLPYLRSRNALKIILDIDQNFGRVKVPAADSAVWSSIPGVPKSN